VFACPSSSTVRLSRCCLSENTGGCDDIYYCGVTSLLKTSASLYRSSRSLLCVELNVKIIFLLGRAIAEVVSRWLPTAAARIQSRVWSSGICGGQSDLGAGFLRVLQFPLPFIPPNSPFSQSPGAGTIGQ
jgi:hypothetical protein